MCVSGRQVTTFGVFYPGIFGASVVITQRKVRAGSVLQLESLISVQTHNTVKGRICMTSFRTLLQENFAQVKLVL